MSFDLTRFYRFCDNLTINSKEAGVIRLKKRYGPQRIFMREVAACLDEDIHDITVLKVRQIGLSTISLALDLYWPFTHEGVDGTLITHDSDTMTNFRTTLGDYYGNLPRSFKPKSTAHNTSEFVFKHRSGHMSRLQYQIAGTRQTENSKLGRAKGNAYLHATEMAFWGDQQGYQSLRNSLAKVNPNRLYVWESTANGFNQFEEAWRIARKAITQRALFIGWWAHELYRAEKGTGIYNTYWGTEGRFTKEERALARDVQLLYGKEMEFVWGTKEISPEQIAWYRFYTDVEVADPDMALQEMPWTEQQAFVTTGSQFFSSRSLTECNKQINKDGAPEYFRIEIKHTMVDSQVISCPKKTANFTVFAAPVEGAHYVMGCDPAYGSSDWADCFVISVWRAYADRLEQVAEYCTPDCLPYAFAWIMAYVAGCYAPCAWNLEVNGPGAAVLGELDSLKRMQFLGEVRDQQMMRRFLAGMREFLYARPDQISRMPTARGTQSNHKEKNRYFDTYRDYFARGMLVPHSRELVEQMRWIEKSAGEAPKCAGRRKDDRVIGGCLAAQMWHDKLRANLMRMGVTYQRTADDAKRTMNIVEQIAVRQRKLLGIATPAQQAAIMATRNRGRR